MRLDEPSPPAPTTIDPVEAQTMADIRALVESFRRKAQRERAQQAEAWERNKDRVIGGHR